MAAPESLMPAGGGTGPRLPRAEVAVIAWGIFVAGLAWPRLLGWLPFGLMLKNELHLSPQRVAAFWAVTTAAWYFKPLVGLVCDAYPLFGTRRRAYLILGAGAGAGLWLAFAVVPRGYLPMMAVLVALNLALVVVSTAVGGMLVEVGQRHGATGRLSSLREGLTGLMVLVAGPLGGWLAGRAFGWTAGTGALILLSFVPLAVWGVTERAVVRPAARVWAQARGQLRVIVRSRFMWAALAIFFLVFVTPGLQTPLLYYQQDVLRFDPQLMGNLQIFGGAGVLVGAAAYGFICRWVPLRTALVAGVILNVGSTLLFLGYDSRTAAILIHAVTGTLGTLAYVPLYDLAARATPRGSESFGYALIFGVQTVTFELSDVLGSYLYGHLHMTFKQLVWINASATAAVLLIVPLLPRALLAAREGGATPGVAA
jgi:MFS family permease